MVNKVNFNVPKHLSLLPVILNVFFADCRLMKKN